MAAPGRSIRSCVPENRYVSMSGTSMATPLVAGSVAVVMQADPSYQRNPEAVKALFQDSAIRLYNSDCSTLVEVPNFVYGYGQLDLEFIINVLASK